MEIFSTWVGRLLVMLLGYGTFFIPGYFLMKYIKKTQFIERAGSSMWHQLIISCVYGTKYDRIGPDTVSQTVSKTLKETSFWANCGKLLFCFTGLQISYLTWGVLQEKIMTKEYVTANGSVAHFQDSQFLVFVNRILAFTISSTYVMLTRQPRHSAPIYKYSYSSFSNIMSSWCQYEALKFVSFPTQVLAKASKIIPTMIMGKIVSDKKYEYYDYVTAVMISMGMTLFLMSSMKDHTDGSTTTTISGVVILVGYMAFDSFTSNWQGELFTQHKMSSVQMMCGVNFFSCLLTSISLLQQGAFMDSIEFMLTFPAFITDCIILSICSATGQLFIFHTIASFGPVIFVIIMTIRQGLAILLSCFIYSHPVSVTAGFGISIVFFAIFLRIYCSHRLKQVRQRTPLESVKV